MQPAAREKIQDIGQLLRWITPTLLVILGWLIIDKLNHFETNQENHGEKLETISQKVTRLEALEDDVLRLRQDVDQHEFRIRTIEINNGPTGP